MPVVLQLGDGADVALGESAAGSCSFPWRRSSWPTRSLPCVRALTRFESEVSAPESTRKTLMRPANGSATVLKTNAAGPPPSTSISSGFFAGEGTPSTIRSSSPVVPRFFVGTPHVTGKSSSRDDRVLERRGELVAGDLVVLEVALHQRLVGLDDGVDQLLAVLGGLRGDVVRDVDRLRLALALGIEVGAHVEEVDDPLAARARGRSGSGSRRSGRRAGCGAARARRRSPRARGRACSRRRRGRARAPPQRSHRRVVCTSTPWTPLTTKSAPSTTRSEASVSAWKPGSPGVSIRLILRSCHARWQTDGGERHLAAVLVLVPVRDGRGALDRAEAVRGARPGRASPRPATSSRCPGGRRRRRSGFCSARTAARVGEFTDLPATCRDYAGAGASSCGRESPRAEPSGAGSPSCGAARRATR